jgi:hypothetical protein
MDQTLFEIGKAIRRLKTEDPGKLAEVLNSLSEKESEQIYYTWPIWSRPEQMVQEAPTWPENIIVYSAGRGY